MVANVILKKMLLILVVSLFGVLGSSLTGLASEITVSYESDRGTVSTTSPVKIVRASVMEEENGIRVTGVLRRIHNNPRHGHLHVSIYSKSGQLLSESDHPVLGLNSNKNGSLQVPFRVLLKDVAGDISNISLKYHRGKMIKS